MKIRPVGADLLRADKQTEGRKCNRKLMVAFRNFANAPKNYKPKDHLEYLSKVKIGLRVMAFDGTK